MAGGRMASGRTMGSLVPLLLAVALALPLPLLGVDLQEQTLPLRAALHKDPTLDAPLDRLVDAWRTAGRLPELVAIYTEHLATYPDDRNAMVVFLRLELAAGDPGAMTNSAAAVAAHADDAYLWWLRSRALAAARDGGSLDALDKAVTLESAPWRKRAWAERLVDEALKAGRPELARRHLAAAAGGDDSAPGRLATARRQAQAGQHDEALTTLTGITDAEPELAVEIDLVAAEQEAALQRNAAAAKRLDAVLTRLAADHWRRAEVLRRRIELAAEGEERDALLAAAQARAAAAPGDDAAVIDQARLLTATDHRQEALDVLVAAYAHAPTPRLEQETLAAFDRVHDLPALDTWLAAQLTTDPTRGDLALRRVRLLIDREQRDQAWALLDATLPRLPEGEGDDRLLALGRELARANRGADAQQALTRLHARRPARLDVTRELADACLAAGRRDQAEALFAPAANGRSLPDGVAAEQVLETVNFLTNKKLTVAAARLAEERLASDPGDFELRLAAVRLEARLGNGAAAESRAVEARVLADTATRYHRWLETLLEAASVDRRSEVLATELKALDQEAGEWTEVRAGRRASFAEACTAADARDLAMQVLRADLLVAPPGDRAPLLRALANLLTGPDEMKELRDTLTALAEEDPVAAPDALARRALIGLADTAANGGYNQEDQTTIPEGLVDLDPRLLTDPVVLDRCWQIYADGNATAKAVLCAERLVQLQPADASRWERWCTSLVATGDEEALRAALRRLLAGVENLPLKPVVRDQLQDALLDSTWRTCARLAAGSSWKELLAVAAEAEPLVRTAQQGRWLAWARCLGLARLGRVKLPDAIAELSRRCGADQQIVFPDGLSTTLDSARAQFTAAAPATHPPATRRGPLPPWHAAWAFTPPGAIAGVLPAADAVLVCDDSGAVSALDPQTGRLRWSRTGLVLVAKPVIGEWGGPTGEMTAARLPVVASASGTAAGNTSGATGELLVAVQGEEIVAYATSDGSLRWRSTLLEAPAGVAAAGGVVVVWNNKEGDCLGLDPATGRVRWTLVLPAIGDQQRAPSPAAASDGVLVAILGAHGGIIDAATGQLRWSASLDQVEAPVPSFTGPAAAAPAPVVMPMGRRRFSSRRRRVMVNTTPAMGYLTSVNGTYPTTIFNPAQSATTRMVGGLLGVAIEGNEPTPDLFAGHLLLSSTQALAVVDLSLPLAAVRLPPAAPAGAWGRRLLLLHPDGATVRDLATGTEHDLDLAPLRPVVDPQADQAPDQQPSIAMPIATMDGRLAWLAGPAGVAAYDLESGEPVAVSTWPSAIAPDPTLPPADQRAHGVIIGERLITPAGGRLLIALERSRDGK